MSAFASPQAKVMFLHSPSICAMVWFWLRRTISRDLIIFGKIHSIRHHNKFARVRFLSSQREKTQMSNQKQQQRATRQNQCVVGHVVNALAFNSRVFLCRTRRQCHNAHNKAQILQNGSGITKKPVFRLTPSAHRNRIGRQQTIEHLAKKDFALDMAARAHSTICRARLRRCGWCTGRSRACRQHQTGENAVKMRVSRETSTKSI